MDMRKLILLTILTLTGSMTIWSQVPQAMNYKAIAKDDWGVALPNKSITLRFTIIQGSENGFEVYRETHNTTTNKFGLMDVEIGNGTADIGSFDGIDWSTGVYYIKIEMDPKGGTDFRLEDPAHQLLSVPYALYAGKADNVANETDPVFISYPAYGITNGNITNWNDAFGWGNHATAGYLESYTETDPVFINHSAFGITNTLIGNWNTAYGWGNHAGLYRPITYVPAWGEITSNPFIITTPSNGQLLKYDGTNWINFTPDYLSSFTELDPVFNVNFDFTGSTTNDLLQFNGTKWVTFTPNFALTNHTHSDATTTISGFMSSTDKTKLDGLQNANGSETKVTAGANVTVTGEGTEATPYVINSTGGGSGSSHYVGEFYGGGVVFYVWDNGQHGLICAIEDQDGWGYGIPQPTWRWYAGTYFCTDAIGVLPLGGEMNTAIIIASTAAAGNDHARYAARVAHEYYIPFTYYTEEEVFGDWYLPAREELLLMCMNYDVIDATAIANGGSAFTNAYYWSSSEFDEENAWAIVPHGNSTEYTRNKATLCCVRAVRSF